MGPHVGDLSVASLDEARRFAHVMRYLRALGGDRPPLAIVGAGGGTPPSDAIELIVLPGAERGAPPHARTVTRCIIGNGSRRTIVVPGAGRLDNRGRYVLSSSAYGRLRAAEALAAADRETVVILSGWSGGHSSPSEAEQLHDAWRGPQETPLLLDPAARTTAENAVNGVLLARSLSECRELIFIAPWGNALRQTVLARAATRGSGIRVRQHVVWGRQHVASLRPGITGLLFMRRHLRAAWARVGALHRGEAGVDAADLVVVASA
jgi:hypothetical protein